MIKNKIILVVLIITLMQFVTAMDINVPYEVKINDDFDIRLADSTGISLVELQIPDAFVVSSDPTGGVLKDGIYRTHFAGSAVITFKAVKIGTFSIKGTWSEGTGVKDFLPSTIKVSDSYYTIKSCPTCPNKLIGSCDNGKRTNVIYECGVLTDYICKQKTAIESCVDKSSCVEDWTCVDDVKIGFQKSDCTFSQVTDCAYGCNEETGTCKTNLLTGAATLGPSEDFFLIRIFKAIYNWIKNILVMG